MDHADKNTERDRYDDRATQVLATAGRAPELEPDGAAGVSLELRSPYLEYERHIRQLVRAGSDVLDVCCGTGRHSVLAGQLGASVTLSDISSASLQLAALRAHRSGFTPRCVVADAEALPLPSSAFDLVTCAGSLSYVDLGTFLSEIRRLLRPRGAFLCVDSLNHNPIYRANRFVHFLRGHRTRAVIQRTPTTATIRRLCIEFPDSAEVSYHGTFAFAAPMLRLLAGRKSARGIIDALDAAAPALHRYAFKFVFLGHQRSA